jgi:hypothetical protein
VIDCFHFLFSTRQAASHDYSCDPHSPVTASSQSFSLCQVQQSMASDLPAVDLCLVPAGPVPHGHHSNFEDPTSLTPVKMAVASLLIFWAVIFTSGRIYVSIRKLSLADYFALVALVLAISVFALMATSTKLDRHIWDTPACYFDGTFAMVRFLDKLHNHGHS